MPGPEQEPSPEVDPNSFGFGEVVLWLDYDNRRAVITGLPNPNDEAKHIQVSLITDDTPGEEVIDALPGGPTPDRLEKTTETPWSAERIAGAMVRDMQAHNPGQADILAGSLDRITMRLKAQAQKPRTPRI